MMPHRPAAIIREVAMLKAVSHRIRNRHMQISTATPIATPTIEISEMNDRKRLPVERR